MHILTGIYCNIWNSKNEQNRGSSNNTSIVSAKERKMILLRLQTITSCNTESDELVGSCSISKAKVPSGVISFFCRRFIVARASVLSIFRISYTPDCYTRLNLQ